MNVRKMILALLAAVSLPWMVQAGPKWSVGLHFHAPVRYRPRPCYGRYHRYRYRFPRPVYVAPAPVIVRPVVPVYQPTVVQPTYSTPPLLEPPPPEPKPVVSQACTGHLQNLDSPDERTRIDAAVQLGRLRAVQAVQPLVRTLNTDRSPAVREAAARGLGLIGKPVALSALEHAAQADEDRDVRRSASFSAEVIRTSLRR